MMQSPEQKQQGAARVPVKRSVLAVQTMMTLSRLFCFLNVRMSCLRRSNCESQADGKTSGRTQGSERRSRECRTLRMCSRSCCLSPRGIRLLARSSCRSATPDQQHHSAKEPLHVSRTNWHAHLVGGNEVRVVDAGQRLQVLQVRGNLQQARNKHKTCQRNTRSGIWMESWQRTWRCRS